MTKKSRQKLKWLSIKQIPQIFLEGESPTLTFRKKNRKEKKDMKKNKQTSKQTNKRIFFKLAIIAVKLARKTT